MASSSASWEFERLEWDAGGLLCWRETLRLTSEPTGSDASAGPRRAWTGGGCRAGSGSLCEMLLRECRGLRGDAQREGRACCGGEGVAREQAVAFGISVAAATGAAIRSYSESYSSSQRPVAGLG